jgi:hypothetical protein
MGKPRYILALILWAITTSIASKNINTESELFEITMPEIQTAKSDIGVFNTPIDFYNGSIYTVNVEPPPGIENGINLYTVIRKGTPNAQGDWQWSKYVLEKRTLSDKYHTQASIIVDKNGYIHVAYNMHNMPWQYSISEKPENINNFIFLGDPVDTRDLQAVKSAKYNYTYKGRAAIPGMQITYPAFFKNNTGDIYITYRFAMRPRLNWGKRSFAGGLAKYDITTRNWTPIGKKLTIDSIGVDLPYGQKSTTETPFTFEDSWSIYLINLAFDANNEMHIVWNWREGGAGRDTTSPTYAFSNDDKNFVSIKGKPYTLPISWNQKDVIGNLDEQVKLYSAKSLAVGDDGTVYVIINPIGGKRTLFIYKNGNWNGEETPFAATEVKVDSKYEWLFSTGVRIFHRKIGSTKWRTLYQEENAETSPFCYPKVIDIESKKSFLIHSRNCNSTGVKIVKVDKKSLVSNAGM